MTPVDGGPGQSEAIRRHEDRQLRTRVRQPTFAVGVDVGRRRTARRHSAGGRIPRIRSVLDAVRATRVSGDGRDAVLGLEIDSVGSRTTTPESLATAGLPPDQPPTIGLAPVTRVVTGVSPPGTVNVPVLPEMLNFKSVRPLRPRFQYCR